MKSSNEHVGRSKYKILVDSLPFVGAPRNCENEPLVTMTGQRLHDSGSMASPAGQIGIPMWHAEEDTSGGFIDDVLIVHVLCPSLVDCLVDI